MKHTVYIIILLFLSAIWISSCQEDDDMFPRSGINNPSATKADITALLNKYSGISLPDMVKSFTSSPTVVTRGQKQDGEGLMIEWDKMQSFKSEKTDIYLVSLQSNSPIVGLAFTQIEGKKLSYMSTAYFKLQVRKTEGRLSGRVMTYIPDSKPQQRQSSEGIAELGYDLSGSDYSGVCLYSTLDGLFIYGEKYDNGKLLFRFHPTIHDHSHESPVALRGDSIKETASMYKIHVNLFNDSKATRAALYSNTESGGSYYCSICGRLADYCNCVTITPDDPWGFCWECGRSKKECKCCKYCRYYPCECYRPGGGGGSTGGGNTGGGSTGGGSTGGSSGISVPSNLQPIFGTNTNLTQAQVNKLSDVYDIFVQGKVGSKLLQTLLQKNIKINFKMDPIKTTPATFYATYNEIIFKNEMSLGDYTAFTEEMTHALQYYGYYNNAMTPAIINYEFEAKLLGDIACESDRPWLCGSTICYGMDGRPEYAPFVEKYNRFINQIINNGWNSTSEDGWGIPADENTYYQLCREWHEYQKKHEPNSPYAKASLSAQLPPIVLIDIYKK